MQTSGQRGEIIKDSFVWDFKMWLLAVLTGDHRAGFHCTQDTTEYYVQDTMLSMNWLKNVSLVSDKTTDIHRLTLEA